MNDIEIAQAVSTILSKFTKATPDEAPATSEAARVDGLMKLSLRRWRSTLFRARRQCDLSVAKVSNANWSIRYHG